MPDENSYNSELLGTLLLIDAQAFAYGDELETLDSIIDAHVANLSPEDQKYVSTLRSFGPELTDKTVDDPIRGMQHRNIVLDCRPFMVMAPRRTKRPD